VPLLHLEINECSENEINITVYLDSDRMLSTSVLFLCQHWSNQSYHCDQQRAWHQSSQQSDL
jgi:hypothetical protein